MTNIIDTSIDFSEVENELILDFIQDVEAEKVEKKKNLGKSSYQIFTGYAQVGITIEEDIGNRFILVCTLNVSIDRHEISENLRNPAELKTYLNDLKQRLNK